MFEGISSLIKNTEIIGLDIGTHSIKIVEIDHRKNGQFLTTFGITNHLVDLDGYWDSTTLRNIAGTIDELMNKSNFVGIKTVMSVRSKDVYVTTMDFEATMSEQAIRDEINRQAQFFLPLPPEQMRLSYDLVNTPTLAGKKRIIINATPDYVIENSRNLLEHLNLDGEAIENATLSHIRACLDAKSSTTLLIDVGGHHTVISSVVNNNLRNSTFIPGGTQTIAKAISDLTGTTIDVAEEFMRDLNLVDLAHVPKPFLEYLEILKDEVTTFVQLNKQIGQITERIIITGGGANTPGILEFFSTIDIPTTLANPLSSVVLNEAIVPFITPVQNQLSVAIGLAKRSDVL
jgi:type IV pilus assembly protein PilM